MSTYAGGAAQTNINLGVGPGAASTVIETPSVVLSKLGGPGATDEVVGSTDTPVVRLTADAQFLSARIISAANWDTSQDVSLIIGVAINSGFTPTNGETVVFNFDYIFVQSGLAATADLGKTVTTIAPTATFTTVGGLVDETLYAVTIVLDRNDPNNPYAGDIAGGGFSFVFNLDSVAGDADSIDVIAVAIVYATNT